MASKRTGIIYIQRYKFQFYSPFLPNVLEFLYVPELIKDMDVTDKVLFENIVKLFIENNKIPLSSLIIVIGDSACFIKDFVGPSIDELKEQAKEFVEHTPFDNVGSKTFSIKNGIRVFATNKELYEFIKEAFEKQNFTVDAVIPGFLMGNNVSVVPDLTVQTAQFIVEKINPVLQYSLLRPDLESIKTEKETEELKEEPKNEKTDSKDKKRLFVLTGVFVMLIVTLVVVYFINYPPSSSQKATASPAVSPPPAVKAAKIKRQPEHKAALITPPMNDEIKGLSVQITSASDSAKQAGLLKEKLENYNFEKVVLKQQIARVPDTIVTFSEKVPNSVREAVQRELIELAEGVRVQEDNDTAFDISIVISR